MQFCQVGVGFGIFQRAVPSHK